MVCSVTDKNPITHVNRGCIIWFAHCLRAHNLYSSFIVQFDTNVTAFSRQTSFTLKDIFPDIPNVTRKRASVNLYSKCVSVVIVWNEQQWKFVTELVNYNEQFEKRQNDYFSGSQTRLKVL